MSEVNLLHAHRTGRRETMIITTVFSFLFCSYSFHNIDESPWLERVDNFLRTQWWQVILWSSTLGTRKGEEYKSGNVENRKPATGFSTEAEPLFRRTNPSGKARRSENKCLLELFGFENSLLTSQNSGLISSLLKSRDFPNLNISFSPHYSCKRF